MKLATYLALGDSYTIGEGVPLHESYPYQLVQLLRRNGVSMCAPEIVAKTGWTTGELQTQLGQYQLAEQYDFCTLLIGVNNQYRKLDPLSFKLDFANLLQLCIDKTTNRDYVFVLSIPDWGVTPFAEEMDRKVIAQEIDQFNDICKDIAGKHQVRYIDITTRSREVAGTTGWVAADGLHPSSAVYEYWSTLLFDHFTKLKQ